MENLKFLLTPLLLTEDCFNTLVRDMDFANVPCLKYGLSKGLGLGIILGSLLVKVPQILKIFRGKSAAGITFISVVLELFAISSNMSYSYCKGFPFSAWGEASFLAIQTSVIAALVLLYNSSSFLLSFSFIAGYLAVLYSLISGITPIDVLWSMQAANVPIILISKMIQAVTNYKNKSTGQLSALTVFLLFLGSVARIFTSIQETGDQIVIITYVAASFANGIIAFQMLYYWKNKMTGAVTGGSKKKQANGKASNQSSNQKSPKKVKNHKIKDN